MRIVGGEFKGKKLAVPEDKRVRPTSDRTREALFNILGHGQDYRTQGGPLPLNASVLDVFCGTGALGVEALSRGAKSVTFMDNHPDSLKLVRQNIAALNAQRQANILTRDGTLPGPATGKVDLVLMDPPYNQGLATPALSALASNGWLNVDGMAVVELAAKEKFDLPPDFEILKEKKYGAARLVFLKYQPA